jgi:Flp pilus assembly CpaE family ATPase
MIKSKENSAGAWAFLIGVVLAVVIGLSTLLIPISALTKYSSFIYLILVVLGIIIGASINVTGRDSQTFLITGAIIVIVSKFGMESVISSLIGIGAGDTASSIFASLSALFVPATIIVALKTVFGMARV